MMNVTKIIISVFDRVENIVEKGEIACTSNFSFSHNVFKRLLSQRHQKVSMCRNGLTLYQATKLWTTPKLKDTLNVPVMIITMIEKKKKLREKETRAVNQ